MVWAGEEGRKSKEKRAKSGRLRRAEMRRRSLVFIGVWLAGWVSPAGAGVSFENQILDTKKDAFYLRPVSGHLGRPTHKTLSMRPVKGAYANAFMRGLFVVRNFQGFDTDSSLSYAKKLVWIIGWCDRLVDGIS